MARRAFGSDADRRTMAEVPGSDLYPESVTIDLDNKDPNAFEVDVVDDTPPEDQGRPNAKRFTADDDEDLSGYADKTRKRIERLKFETHSERRQREQAERERDEAVAFARQRDAEVADLRKRLESGGTALASSMVAEREARLNDAERRLASAHADGDGAAIAAATKDMTTASAELAQIRARVAKPAGESERPQERQPEQPQRQQAEIAPQVLDWISHNRSWFNKDKSKTQVAIGISRSVEAEGIRPSDPEYTREVDKRMKQMYPDHKSFDANDDQDGREKRAPRRTYGGEPTGRVQEDRETSNPRKITLTATQVALANKLGVSLQDYAIQAQKLEAKGKGA